MKLISMTDFVIEQNLESESAEHFYNDCYNYAKFLKQPLELGMFVPCGEDGGVLEEPKDEGQTLVRLEKEINQYHQAKERCLFNEFKVQNTKDWIDYYKGIRVFNRPNDLQKYTSIVFRETEIMNKTIEDLTKYDLQLTQTAIKQLGL